MWVSSASLSGDYAVWVAPRNPAALRVELLAYDLATGRRTSITRRRTDDAFAAVTAWSGSRKTRSSAAT